MKIQLSLLALYKADIIIINNSLNITCSRHMHDIDENLPIVAVKQQSLTYLPG
jgi:hypothetical protein